MLLHTAQRSPVALFLKHLIAAVPKTLPNSSENSHLSYTVSQQIKAVAGTVICKVKTTNAINCQ